MADLDALSPETPISKANRDQFQNGEALFHNISRSINDGEKYFIVFGPEKSGKTSFSNIIPEYLPEGFIGVLVSLEFLGEDPIFSMFDQIFSAVFRKLIEKGYLDEKNEFFKSWSRQVNGGELGIDPSNELLALGSRIALHLNNPNSAITIDKGLIQNDWLKLKNFTAEIFPKFENFMIILDDPQQLLNIDPKTQNTFYRIFDTEESPLLLVTANLPSRSATSNKPENSLFEHLMERLPEVGKVFSLMKLGTGDISEIIRRVHPELGPAKLDQVARSVHRVTEGHPYLVKLLLSNMDKRATKTGNFGVDTASCENLIKSQHKKLSLESLAKFTLLKSLKSSNKEDFLRIAAILLATSISKTSPTRGNKPVVPNKSLTEVVLSGHAPKPINASTLDSELQTNLKTLRDTWPLDLFKVVDNDGKLIDSSTYPDSSFISLNSKISTEIDPLVLAYIRISARELNNDFRIPSSKSYFNTTTSLFASDLIRFLVNGDEPLRSIRHIRAYNPANKNDTSDEGMTSGITQALLDDDLQTLYSYFYISLRTAMLFDQRDNAFGNRKGKPFIFNLIFSELNLPEIREFSYILNLEGGQDLETIQSDFQSWIETNAPFMELSYKIKIVGHSFNEFPEDLFSNLVFLSSRSSRFGKAFDLFKEDNFQDLKNYLSTDLEREINLYKKYAEFSEFHESFQRLAQPFSYMAASVGLFKTAQSGFQLAIRNNYSNTLMIEDNQAITYANLGEIEKAVQISWKNLQMLREKPMGEDEYWKLIFVPFKSSTTELGANSIFVDNWYLFIYELQHAVFLLVKKLNTPLAETERDFLKVFNENLSQDQIFNLLDTKIPVHRLLAFYLTSVDSRAMAEEILDHFILESKECVQVQAAISDLAEIRQVKS